MDDREDPGTLKETKSELNSEKTVRAKELLAKINENGHSHPPKQNPLKRFLFIQTRTTSPDGRPLYAYKCRTKDYSGIKMVVRETIDQAIRGLDPIIFKPLFCLYAAETWRRKHTGGAWAWETVFAEIDSPVPNHQTIVKWVEGGLRYWKRPILEGANGRHEYLVTIACEGGLPLLLLQREGASLYRYFKNLLEFYHKEKQGPFCDPEAIAKRLSSYLPKRLRQDIVYKLGGELVAKIVELQETVIDAIDPIKALDEQNKDWRTELPLPVEDDTVEVLLKNLVLDATVLAVTARQRIRWRRRLLSKGNEYTVEQRLEIPKVFNGSVLQQWGNRTKLPTRMRLLIRSERGTEPVALITRLRGDNETASYRCEQLRRQGVRFTGNRALEKYEVLLSDDVSETVIPAQGANDWGPLPWLFTEKDAQWNCIGEGSLRCRDETINILFPIEGRVRTEDGTVTPLGKAPEIDRELCQITGTVVWEHEELGFCRIRCGNPDATDVSYVLDGKTIPMTAEQTPPFHGMPRLLAVNQNDTVQIVEDAVAEWRPYKTGELSWRKDTHHCAGEVWLRWANSEGEQVICRKVRVLPANASVKIDRVGMDQQSGKLHLNEFLGASVRVGAIAGCRFGYSSDHNRIEIDCFAKAGLPITHFPADLYWPDGRSLQVQLPFPQEGAAFVYADDNLSPGVRVPVAKLATIQAVAQAPSMGAMFFLKVSIKADNNTFQNLRIHERLEVDESGRSGFQLHRLQDRIASILALTGELDSTALLEIVDMADRRITYLEAGQFDMSWKADWENRRLTLPQPVIERLEPGWQDRISVHMVSLWNPSADPVLVRNGDTAIDWEIPGDLEPGPWWVLGEDGDWARFRPLMWVIPGDTRATNSPLLTAVLTDDQDVRDDSLFRWVEQIAQDSDHPDWPLFFDYLNLVRPYPACSLDLFKFFVHSPEAMVMALLKSSDENFNVVWSLSYQMPFSWYLMPISAWLASAKNHFNTLRVALSGLDSADEYLWSTFQEFRERVTDRRPFRQICDWLSPVIFPGQTLENSELAIAQKSPEMILTFIKSEEQQLLGRHDAEERYPAGPLTMEMTTQPDYPSGHTYGHLSRPFRPVRCAPFVAAHICLYGIPYEAPLLFELKMLRDFDREWFKAVFAFALCLGLSKIPVV